MFNFYFNDCLPEKLALGFFVDNLTISLIEFKKLLDKDIQIEASIITHDLPSLSNYGNEFTLQDALQNINNIDLRKYAFSLFYKYPINKYYDDSDDYFLNEFILNVGSKALNATNAAIVGANQGFLFTCKLHPDIEKHPLNISVNPPSKEIIPVNNLYGINKNTDDIEKIIREKNLESLDTYGQLLAILRNPIVSEKFEKSFNSLRQNEKQSIIDDFKKAIDRDLITRFYPDTKIISDVSSSKFSCSVYELRVYTPTALRVYFNESNGRVYLGDIGFKNSDNQNAEIKAAYSLINKLLLTN